jgi:hypothetical protein
VAKSGFAFKTFDQTAFEATKHAWCEDADRGCAFPSEIEQLMDWVEGHMRAESGRAVACGVFQSGSHVADAVCEVVITRQSMRSKWVKMLRVRLRPKIDDALNSTGDSSTDVMREALGIFAKAALGLLTFGQTEKASTIKIYGRTRTQLEFLRFLGVELENLKKKELQTSMEGKFLVVQ